MTKYRLMGLDRFSYEDYECGDFDTMEEAMKAKREQEIVAKRNASDSSIEDRYWIIKIQEEMRL